jgi:hypothetical protein
MTSEKLDVIAIDEITIVRKNKKISIRSQYLYKKSIGEHL